MATIPATHVTAHTPTERLDLVEQYAPSIRTGWSIGVDPGADAWVLDWSRAMIVVTSLDDLEFARISAAARADARRHLRRHVIATALELGLPTGPHLRPAGRPPLDVTGRRRCPGCGANVRATDHRPGGDTCDLAREDREAGRRE